LKDYFSPSSASDFRNCSFRFAMKEQPEPPAITANVTANDHSKYKDKIRGSGHGTSIGASAGVPDLGTQADARLARKGGTR
jgi:hypothetical protein